MKVKRPKQNNHIKKTRKQLRKEGRKDKKARKHEFYTNRKKPGQFVLKPPSDESEDDVKDTKKVGSKPKQDNTLPDQSIRDMQKEKQKQQQLQKQMDKLRNKQLLDANLEEDRNIKKLEKQLKINKRKTKAVPKSFVEDGLDYLLEVCDSENMQGVVSAEQQLNEVNEEFEEDFALMTGKSLKKSRKDEPQGMAKDVFNEENADSDDDFESFLNEDDGTVSESEPEESAPKRGNKLLKAVEASSDENSVSNDDSELEDKSSKKQNKLKKTSSKLLVDAEDNSDESEPESTSKKSKKRPKPISTVHKTAKKQKLSEHDSAEDEPLKKSKPKNNPKGMEKNVCNAANSDSDDDFESFLNEDDGSDSECDDSESEHEKMEDSFSDNIEDSDSGPEEASSKKQKKLSKASSKLLEDVENSTSEESGSEPEEASYKKSNKIPKTDEEIDSADELSEDESGDDEEGASNKNCAKKNDDGTWEDIYGRSRDRDGNIVNKSESSNQTKYVPPAIRAKMENALPEDAKRLEKLNRLKKQLKGLLNRLAESNMHNICTQLEDLYMKNSRNDMNETLTALIIDALVANVATPECLLLEHVVLVTILHANIGTEVGAHFLQTIVKKFDEVFCQGDPVENKTLDNLINIIAQLYNFKVFDSKLLYQILNKLSNKFEEKEVECILHVLKSVGFTLRRNDPIALKDLILDLQKQAAIASAAIKDNPRVQFMLDILLAIKNNNMNKIPNYDTSYAEHLKKIMKGFIRKGNYVTQLNIGLDDLLKADERGKWWVVGSAWTGKIGEDEEADTTKKDKSKEYSQKLLALARKQRMNTDIRRNIFCIIMSAEDYLDAFEKILHLGLKNQQEREIIHVILHCCLQEKQYNPYYGVLSQKFCDYDRKYQMTIKFSVWDKLKTLTDHSGPQISNLAKLLSHLFLEKGLPISTLKIVQFGELDKVTLRFIRQVLLGILLSDDVEQCQGVFEKVGQSDKLKMFRESLRLFILHFLLRNLNSDSIPVEQKTLLEDRAKMVEKILTVNDKRTRF